MPIFEFKCMKCGHIQEFILKNNDEAIELKCEKCGGEELSRILSQVSYTVSSPSGKATLTSKRCGSNSCTTMTLPGSD
ncbi:FmdB family zinc ribbon protein [Desulfonauticus submarinus]|uniref:Putative regulatory protein, FmdB family n=1 Tax=Desulfonauticus submarinus TaxID=206665 RepID=A0A1H0ALB6_9BACT|nr:zinc ribbon domain-containing protein [Desulfonauticus submarinus]SDN34257.1 putative regulatory protein, FmdB family [Desulfonauticus submarinus]